MNEPGLLIKNARQIVVCDASAPDGIGLLDGGHVYVLDGLIHSVGSDTNFEELQGTNTRSLDATGCTVTPGLIDAHTHVVFAGDRSVEYFHRTAGWTDKDFVARNVPEGADVSRAVNTGLSAEELFEHSVGRARGMLGTGTTTFETKSGYGFNTKDDIASLDAAKLIAAATGQEIARTYFGPHIRPNERADTYLDEVISETIPMMAELELAEFCDVFVDTKDFTIEECRRVLSVGNEYGLRAKLHTDARANLGGAKLAVEMNAVSVDHCNLFTDADLGLLADAGIIAVCFPGFDLAVGHSQPIDAKRFSAFGVNVALATDLCPVCWHLSQQMTFGLGCRLNGFTPEQAMLGVTINAAKALAREDRIGSLQVGKEADIVVFEVPDYRQIAFRLGTNQAKYVIKRGVVLCEPKT